MIDKGSKIKSQSTYYSQREGERRKAPTPTQMKQFSSCQQTKYDRAISLKAAAESAPPYGIPSFKKLHIFRVNTVAH